MDGKKFNEIVSRQFEWCRETLGVKALEYEAGAGADKFHAFDRAAALLGCGRKRALAGMLAKHIVSVFDMCEGEKGGVGRPLETWEEKITDSINYLLLLKAMVVEESESESESELETGWGNGDEGAAEGRFRAAGKGEMKK